MTRKNSFKPTAQVFLVLVALVYSVGCEAARDVRSTPENLRESTQRTRANLQEIQQYGEVDLQLRMVINAFFAAYRAAEAHTGRAPQNWSEVFAAGPLANQDAGLLREAQQALQVHWGTPTIDPATAATSETEAPVLATGNANTSGRVVVVLADGKVLAKRPEEFDSN